MDFLKIFPSLILDIISKVIPGTLCLAVFQDKYLPLYDILTKVFDPQYLSAEWQSWHRVTIVLCSAYFIGVLNAIFSNIVESFLIEKIWYPKFKKDSKRFLYLKDQSLGLNSALSSARSFALCIDYYRYFVYVNNPNSAIMLEKYRTAFRMFLMLLFLSIFIPLSMGKCFYIPIAAIPMYLVWYTSEQYLSKSIQLYSLTRDISA